MQALAGSVPQTSQDIMPINLALHIKINKFFVSHSTPILFLNRMSMSWITSMNPNEKVIQSKFYKSRIGKHTDEIRTQVRSTRDKSDTMPKNLNIVIWIKIYKLAVKTSLTIPSIASINNIFQKKKSFPALWMNIHTNNCRFSIKIQKNAPKTKNKCHTAKW